MDRQELEKYGYLLEMDLGELMDKADGLRRKHIKDSLQLCSIVNAKSGRCSEDCKFCAQSGHYETDSNVYGLMREEEIVEAAKEAKKIGSGRFGIVTSGNALTEDEVERLAETVERITKEVGIGVCGSLGALEAEQLSRLKQAGMSRYHHNIETSRSFYRQIVSTHDFEQRVDTVRAAKESGMEVCSGGIIGLGESFEDRLEMALILRELDVDSVPINVLVPIKGTPLEGSDSLGVDDVLKTICIFRILLPGKTVKIAAGREPVLKDRQLEGFKAGANGMIIGGYLTVSGSEPGDDKRLIDRIRELWKE